MAIQAGTVLRALRGLIEVQTRALDEDLPGALQEVVEQLARVLDVRAVAINLLRPAWDDFEIVAIHAPPEIIDALQGGKVPRSTVETLLDPAFDVGGAFFIPAGAIDEADLGGPARSSRGTTARTTRTAGRRTTSSSSRSAPTAS